MLQMHDGWHVSQHDGWHVSQHDGWHVSQHEFNCCKSCPVLIEYNTLLDSSYATKLIVNTKIVSIEDYDTTCHGDPSKEAFYRRCHCR